MAGNDDNDDDDEEEVEGSSGRSLEVTCSVNERNSSSYRSNGIDDDMVIIYIVLLFVGLVYSSAVNGSAVEVL